MSTHALFEYKTTPELSAWYDQKYSDMGGGWDCPRSEALRYIEFMELPQDKSKTLLDVGCGQGHFTAVAGEFVVAAGIDISPVIIAKAKQTYPGIVFGVDDIETMDVSGHYDYIATIGSVEHCIDVPKALKNICTILADDGAFYALVPNEEWPHMDQPNEVTHTEEEWMDLFADAGFRQMKIMRHLDISHFLLRKAGSL